MVFSKIQCFSFIGEYLVFPTALIKETNLYQLHNLDPFVKKLINLLRLDLLLGFSVPISLCMFLCRFHSVLITLALKYTLNQIVWFHFCSFSRLFWLSGGYWWFSTNFKNYFISVKKKKVIEILTGISVIMIRLYSMNILILILPMYECRIAFTHTHQKPKNCPLTAICELWHILTHTYIFTNKCQDTF